MYEEPIFPCNEEVFYGKIIFQLLEVSGLWPGSCSFQANLPTFVEQAELFYLLGLPFGFSLHLFLSGVG